MPTELIAQDNAAIYENTKIAVTGREKAKKGTKASGGRRVRKA